VCIYSIWCIIVSIIVIQAVREGGQQVGVICQHVIVIELDKSHVSFVIVFLSKFHIVTMPRTKSGFQTFFTYTDLVFLLFILL
jgi:hypothetical protein